MGVFCNQKRAKRWEALKPPAPPPHKLQSIAILSIHDQRNVLQFLVWQEGTFKQNWTVILGFLSIPSTPPPLWKSIVFLQTFLPSSQFSIQCNPSVTSPFKVISNFVVVRDRPLFKERAGREKYIKR